MRDYTYSRDVRAGCFDCHGGEPMWTAKNAQGLAAQHHDRTGHTTWVDVYMCIRYGGKIEEASK